MSDTCILWFRKDLRLDDNPALMAAAKHKRIIPLFIFDKSLEEYNKIGDASHWWLEKSLSSLNKDLNQNLNILLIMMIILVSLILMVFTLQTWILLQHLMR